MTGAASARPHQPVRRLRRVMVLRGLTVSVAGPLAARSAALAPAALAAASPSVAPAPGLEPAQAPLDAPAAEMRLVDMINGLRASKGVGMLEADETCRQLARERSKDMADRKYFSHQIPDVGFAPQWLLDQLPDAYGTGENLGLSDEDNSKVVDALFTAWQSSPSHLENMVRAEFTHLGVGIVEMPGPSEGVTVKLATQVFAVADPGPLTRA